MGKTDTNDDELLAEVIQLIIGFVNYEIKYSKDKLIIPYDNESIKFSVDNIKESLRFEYIEYIVCDLTILSQETGLLAD